MSAKDARRSNGIDPDDEQRPVKKQAKHDSGAADLEKVTDYVEETELNPQNVAEVSIRVFLSSIETLSVVLTHPISRLST